MSLESSTSEERQVEPLHAFDFLFSEYEQAELETSGQGIESQQPMSALVEGPNERKVIGQPSDLGKETSYCHQREGALNFKSESGDEIN
jgi:hypothetical protein